MKRCSYELAKNGIKRNIGENEEIIIKGKIAEIVTYKDVEIEVIEIDEADLKDFDFDEEFENHGLSTLENTTSDLDSLCMGDSDSPYIWCSALIKAKGEYWVVSFDFFTQGLTVGE